MDAIQEKFAIVEREFEDVTLHTEDVYKFIAEVIKAGQHLAAQVIAEHMAHQHEQVEAAQADVDGCYSSVFLEAMRAAFFPSFERGQVTFPEYTAFERQADVVTSLLLVLALRKKNDGRT